MLDLGIESHVLRLHTAIDHSRQVMLPARKNREEMLEQFCGTYYNKHDSMLPVYVNLMNMTAEVYTLGLAANNPRVKVVAESRQLWPFAFKWTHSLNNMIKEMRFRDTLQACVMDAFFVGGIAKVHQKEWNSIQLETDEWADPGRPYISHVSFDDFVLDMSVKDRRRCKFMTEEYRVSWDSVQNDPDFDKSVVKQMFPTSKHQRGDTQAHDIGSGGLGDHDEYEPMTDLMDVWLPELEKIGVFPRHVKTKPLKLVDAGPEGGPFKFLSLGDVPDNVLPAAPGQNLMPLHKLYNSLLRKQARQAKRQKTNPTFRPTAADVATKHKNANDGEWIPSADPGGINVISQGGVDPTNTAFSVGVLDLFDRQAGNLSAMAGLGPQAGTLGQEELIAAAVSRKEANMQQKVHSFVSELMGSLGHLMWADEVLNIPGSVPIREGSTIHRDTTWTAEAREGDEWEYSFEVEPASTNYESPAAKLAKLERAMDKLVQMYPIIQANGGTIDVRQMQRDYADMLNIPELNNWITYASPDQIEQMMQQQGQGDGVGKPAETTRNYVRRNVATGGTPQNRASVTQQAWLGAGQTPQQMATLGAK